MAKQPGGSKTGAGRLRTRAEERIRLSEQDVARMPVKDVQQLVNELQLHEIELEMQNEELRRTQAELEAARDHYMELYDFCPAGHLTLDTFGTIVENNLRAAALLGINRKALIGQSLTHFIASGDQDIFRRHYEDVVNTGDRQVCEVQLREKNNASHWVFLESLAVHKEPKEATLWQMALLDITERKQLEAQFRQAQKMEAVGCLAGGVAHDFNNLLIVINGYSALLLDQLPPEDPRLMMVKETLKAGERAGELTRQLLAFSRKQLLRLQPLNLNDSIRSIGLMLNRLLGESIALTIDLEPDLWTIRGDKGQIDQIIMNLAVNARDAMPNGGTVTIATRNITMTPGSHAVVRPGDYVHLSFRDTGHGMSPETLSHLFEPFFTTKDEGQGTGLGLATAYGIVKQSEGYIFADSALDQGSTFHIYCPRVVEAPAVVETPAFLRRGGSESLLVVEDQNSVRALIVLVLTQYGYRVIEATGGEDALRVAASLPEPVQALVIDVVMPQMSGLVVAERLRRMWPGIRVLFMSGYSDQIKSALLDEPGTSFIQKPFLPVSLAKRLRDLLDQPIERKG